jgi:hypothetical protein
MQVTEIFAGSQQAFDAWTTSSEIRGSCAANKNAVNFSRNYNLWP